MDPHIVLGGFPVGPDFRNYSADATALVVTYPVDSREGNRAAALAWESAFVELAKGKLSAMAAAANLTLSFSSERSVQVRREGEGRGGGARLGGGAGDGCGCGSGGAVACKSALLLLLLHAGSWGSGGR
jgi:Niemann-Pick C1 protein